MTISTHVLDAARGRPFTGITVSLQRRDGTEVAAAETNADGRITGWGEGLEAGVYRLVFDTSEAAPFFPEVVLTFDYSDPTKWKVQLEAEGKDESGKPVQSRVEGILENIGAHYRVFHGTWSEGGKKGDFTVTRN